MQVSKTITRIVLKETFLKERGPFRLQLDRTKKKRFGFCTRLSKCCHFRVSAAPNCNRPFSCGRHVRERLWISYLKPRVYMYGNDFKGATERFLIP